MRVTRTPCKVNYTESPTSADDAYWSAISLTDAELREISEAVWKELKTDPDAAKRIFTEAGWLK